MNLQLKHATSTICFSFDQTRRGAAAGPASAGGYNIGNTGSSYSVSSALGDYGRFTGNIGVHGAYGGQLGLGAALGTYGGYLNEVGGGGYGGAPSTYDTGYGFGGTFYNKGY